MHDLRGGGHGNTVVAIKCKNNAKDVLHTSALSRNMCMTVRLRGLIIRRERTLGLRIRPESTYRYAIYKHKILLIVHPDKLPGPESRPRLLEGTTH
jgi:hypothetical protein